MTDETERPRVAIVLKGYPRLSETFIAQEILGLIRLGLDVGLVSLRLPTDEREHPVHREIGQVPNYLPEYLYTDIPRVFRSWLKARRLPGYAEARRLFLSDWRRDRTPNRGRRFGQALVLAAELPPETGLIYVHFLHTPGSVARYAGIMRGLPFAVSAHAKDIWTIPAWEKREKLADCAFLVTCTAANAAHLAALAPDPARVGLVYHGLDLHRFPAPPPAAPGGRDGTDPADPVRLLSVGRLVDKKGYAGLFDALGRLRDLAWRLEIAGGGPLKAELKARAERLGIAERIHFAGSMTQSELLERYRAADLFVLNCRVSDDGDRDGLPNVLMEAQSQRLAAVSTAVSAVPEIIRDGETGLLASPDDPEALAAVLRTAIGAPELRARLGAAGEAHLRARFGHEAGIRAVFERIRRVLAR
ncbi:colanic acid biosynthesis glycosyltransferase WcaL [Aureimonas endophytica]|uniref:Colanic acid biosynthesis glycosyltransferase WcaL n=1 Tax=Aureimonas endophytica TaxID=2027858 RepID=A0A916ZX96_9HYPH|nr:glycosyltransferase family 4 protein [Aureimonas endophytica]GGE15851.1 colanic acid biosynthesis glycosyltransferase WcaL [Aureimonas endophytica]